MAIDSNIGNEIRNISKKNDKGNINFDIDVYGVTFRILDCPASINTDAKKRALVNRSHLISIRETYYKMKAKKIERVDYATDEDYIKADEDYIKKMKKFRSDGIKDFEVRALGKL